MIYTLDSHAVILQLSARHRLAVETLRNNGAKFCDGRHLARRELLSGLRSNEDGPHGIATGAKIFRRDGEQCRRVTHRLIVESIVQRVPGEGGNLSTNYLDGLCDDRSKANGGFRYERFAEPGR